jgi:hypothetical protein
MKIVFIRNGHVLIRIQSSYDREAVGCDTLVYSACSLP